MKLKALLALAILLPSVLAWSNGNSLWEEETFVDDPMYWQRTNMFGTHDYLAKAALDMLAEQAPEEAAWVSERLYFYGTELPDSRGYDESINDLAAQYLRFDESGDVEDDSLATRSMKKYELLLNSLSVNATGTASKWAGVIASYISDAGLFPRVLEEKVHGLDYETYMIRLTDIVYPSSEFEEIYGGYIQYDGMLEIISPYDAVMKIGAATYLGRKDGSCSAGWMDDNYDLDDTEFIECTGRNLDNIINAIADVLHTAYQAGVNGLEYEWYAYDWESYGEWGASDGAEGPDTGEVEEELDEQLIDEDDDEEPAGEPPAEPDTKDLGGLVGVAFQPSEPEPEGVSLGLWPIIMALILIAAVLMLTLVRVRKGKPRKEKPPKPDKPVRRTKVLRKARKK